MSEIDERLPRAASAAASGAMPSATPEPGQRRTLAMRLAERNGQRELRTARLARLRGAGEADPPGRAPRGDPVLEVYLPAQAAVSPPEDELAYLPGAGPGLTAALRRAGIARLGDLAGIDPAALAARLGPIGRLVPVARWIALARAAAPGVVPPARSSPETTRVG